ncbi:hypothetical protein [Catenuloplanes japonicus]|uniref:hypothetical protein n=1 Tax=Catenuloplanes japonicus TaxID=33876 RepID=UPI000AD1A327|nr:hypothetical protein [Catenuloplanes japonicus]
MDAARIAALQKAFLEGREDSSQLTALSRPAGAAASSPAAAPGGSEKRVVRRTRHVAFLEQPSPMRAVRVLRLHGGRLIALKPEAGAA